MKSEWCLLLAWGSGVSVWGMGFEDRQCWLVYLHMWFCYWQTQILFSFRPKPVVIPVGDTEVATACIAKWGLGQGRRYLFLWVWSVGSEFSQMRLVDSIEKSCLKRVPSHLDVITVLACMKPREIKHLNCCRTLIKLHTWTYTYSPHLNTNTSVLLNVLIKPHPDMYTYT